MGKIAGPKLFAPPPPPTQDRVNLLRPPLAKTSSYRVKSTPKLVVPTPPPPFCRGKTSRAHPPAVCVYNAGRFQSSFFCGCFPANTQRNYNVAFWLYFRFVIDWRCHNVVVTLNNYVTSQRCDNVVKKRCIHVFWWSDHNVILPTLY